MKVNSSKNGRFRYETIREAQPEMELLEVVALIAKSRPKFRTAYEIQQCCVHSRQLPKEHSIAGFYMQF